jgi:serine/threonine protein kinase
VTEILMENFHENDQDEWAILKDVCREMTIQEIEERYHITGIISQNRNSSRRLAIHPLTEEQVVFKILNKSSLKEQHKKLLLYREIRTLQMLADIKNVTELYEVIDTGDRIYIILEYASGGELFEFVKAKAPFSDSLCREIFRPITKVIAYMHSLNLVHRDLKLEKVL